MPMIKKNKLIPIVVVVAVVVIGGLFMRAGPEKHVPMTEIPKAGAKSADGDTTADTVRALTAEVSTVKEQQKQQISENKKLVLERNELINNRTAIEENVTRKLTEQFSRPEASGSPVFSSLNAKLENLTNIVEKLAPNGTSPGTESAINGDIPPGLGFGGSATPSSSSGQKTSSTGQYTWVRPLGQRIATTSQGQPKIQPNGEPELIPSAYSQSPTASTNADVQQPFPDQSSRALNVQGQPRVTDSAFSQAQGQQTATPYFTIPENATLINASALTTILGRIPVQGSVRDPLEFKVLIGRPNLAANGLDVPDDVYGMVVTGTAIGDWNLQCVEGHIYSVTFLFADGTVRTISKRRGGGQPAGGTNNAQRIGYISDEYGTPCISGKLVTNAPAYLTQVVGIKFLETAAQAAAAAQTTTTSSALTGGSQTSVTGDQSKFILGQAASGGFNEVSNYFLKRLNDGFDAIYVQPGTKVAVHINEELTLDKDPNARRLDYGRPNTTSAKRRTRLD